MPPDKVSKLLAIMDEALKTGRLSSGLALKLCGKLNFALSTATCRSSRSLLRVMFSHAHSRGHSARMDATTIVALKTLRRIVADTSTGSRVFGLLANRHRSFTWSWLPPYTAFTLSRRCCRELGSPYTSTAKPLSTC